MDDNDDNMYIEFIDFHEEIEDIKRKLKFLDYDSHHRLVSLYLQRCDLQPEIHSELKSSIEIANNLKHAIKSILLPYNSSTSTTTSTSPTADLIIPSGIEYIRSKIIYLVIKFNYLMKNHMKDYVEYILFKLEEAVSSLSAATGILIIINDDYLFSTKDRDLAVMMTIRLKEAVKERHEEMMKIEKGMEELVQVLFEMYVMVQKPYMVMNGGAGVLHKDIETLVRRNDEFNRKRYDAEMRRGLIKFCMICVVLVVTWALFSYFYDVKEIEVVGIVAAIVILLLLSFILLFILSSYFDDRLRVIIDRRRW